MPSKSKAQQRFMGMVHGVQKGTVDPDDVSDKVKKAAKGMSKKSAKTYASTKHKGLPNKVKKENEMSEIEKFREYIRAEIVDILNEEEGKRKIYVLPGKEAPKGKKVHKGPRGGTFFYGTDKEKQDYEAGEEEPMQEPEEEPIDSPEEEPVEEPVAEPEQEPSDVAMEPAEQWLNRYTDEYQGNIDEKTAAEFVYDNWEEITGVPYDPEEHGGKFPNEVYDFMEIAGLDFDDFAEEFQNYAEGEIDRFGGYEDDDNEPPEGFEGNRDDVDWSGPMVRDFFDQGYDKNDEDAMQFAIENWDQLEDTSFAEWDPDFGLPPGVQEFIDSLGLDVDNVEELIQQERRYDMDQEDDSEWEEPWDDGSTGDIEEPEDDEEYGGDEVPPGDDEEDYWDSEHGGKYYTDDEEDDEEDTVTDDDLNDLPEGETFKITDDRGTDSYYKRVGTNSKGYATFKEVDPKTGKTRGRETALHSSFIKSIKAVK